MASNFDKVCKLVDSLSVEEKWQMLDRLTASLRSSAPVKKAAAADAEPKVKREISGGQKVWLDLVAKVRQIVYDEIKPEKKDQKPILAIAGKLKEDGITEITSETVTALYKQYITDPWQSKSQKKRSDSDTESVASMDAKDREIYRYLFSLKKSGTTNMLDSGRFLVDRFGMTKTDAEKYVLNYIDNYEELKRKYE